MNMPNQTSAAQERERLEIEKLKKELSWKTEWLNPKTFAAFAAGVAMLYGAFAFIKVDRAKLETERAVFERNVVVEETKRLKAEVASLQKDAQLAQQERDSANREALEITAAALAAGSPEAEITYLLRMLPAFNISGVHNRSTDVVHVVLEYEDEDTDELVKVEAADVLPGMFYAFSDHRKFLGRVRVQNTHGYFKVGIGGMSTGWPAWLMSSGIVVVFDGTTISHIRGSQD